MIAMGLRYSLLLGALFLFGVNTAGADELPVLRIGSMKSGTLNWELDTIKRLRLDNKYGFNLEVVPAAGKSGILISMLGDTIDIMVNDWLWISNQRSNGLKLTGVPYSTAVGALLVQPKSSLTSLSDLGGKKIGIVGGPLDVNWLLLQATLIEQGTVSVDAIETVYGAAPLISKKLEQGELDAALLFWHFAARLNVQGYSTLVNSATLMQDMAIPEVVPMLVYTFRETAAERQPDLFLNFFRAAYEAKRILLNSDEAWSYLRESMNAGDEATYQSLIRSWREGVPLHWNESDIESANRLFEVLYEMAGSKLVKTPAISEGTFWEEFNLQNSLPTATAH